ncbi:MAG: Na+/H+ antiporter NhaC family protein [Planctomycetota bacterium]
MKKLIQLVFLFLFIAGLGVFLNRLIPHQTLFRGELQDQETLSQEKLSEELRAHFEKAQIKLSESATLKIQEKGVSWILEDPLSKRKFELKKQENQFILKEDGIHITPLIPPLLAIGLALITKEVLSALFLGVYSAVLIILWKKDFSSITGIAQTIWFSIETSFIALLRVVDQYAVTALLKDSNIKIILFTLLVGGTIGVISASGGLRGIVDQLSKLAKNSVLGQFSAFLMGIFIFFDDYASCLIVGKTARPLTDKMRVSREKLSFIVDSTAAPIASLAIISTWIGTEVGYIKEQFDALNVTGVAPYVAFLQSLPFRFYALFLMIFILLTIFMKREFGPMYRAEIRARETGETLRKDSNLAISNQQISTPVTQEISSRWYNAVLPIMILILGVMAGMYWTGREKTKSMLETKQTRIQEIQGTLKTNELTTESQEKLNGEEKSLTQEINETQNSWLNWGKAILGNCDSYNSLLWASLISSIIAILLVLCQRILSLQDIMNSWSQGLISVVPALLILVLAWSLSATIGELKTNDEFSKLLSERVFSETYRTHLTHLFPAIIFMLASFMSFATGTSWGTMGILFPLAIPMIVILTTGNDFSSHQLDFLYMTIGAVLTGAIFGDHCSPISDTTILSSLGCEMDHMDHVDTQMPYALLVGVVSLIFGYIPAGYGWPLGYIWTPYLWMGIGTVVMALLLLVIGKPVPNYTPRGV